MPVLCTSPSPSHSFTAYNPLADRHRDREGHRGGGLWPRARVLKGSGMRERRYTGGPRGLRQKNLWERDSWVVPPPPSQAPCPGAGERGDGLLLADEVALQDDRRERFEEVPQQLLVGGAGGRAGRGCGDQRWEGGRGWVGGGCGDSRSGRRGTGEAGGAFPRRVGIGKGGVLQVPRIRPCCFQPVPRGSQGPP